MDGTLLFEGTVISHKLSHRKFSIFFCRHLFVCNNSMVYLKNWIDNFFQIFFMGTFWVVVSINNIKTRASREMTSRKNIKILYFNGVNIAKHWHMAGRGICHL